jgi:hypothetical protein
MMSLIVAVTHHDTSTSTRRHPFALDFGRGKSEKVYELEVFCEVVRFPRVERDFLFRGCEEVICGNKYFLRQFPKFSNDRPLTMGNNGHLYLWALKNVSIV